jgi:hypothetical protein
VLSATLDNLFFPMGSLGFEPVKKVRHTRRRFNFVKQSVQDEWHTLVLIGNQSMVAGGMAKVLAKNYLLNKIQYLDLYLLCTVPDTTKLDACADSYLHDLRYW